MVLGQSFKNSNLSTVTKVQPLQAWAITEEDIKTVNDKATNNYDRPGTTIPMYKRLKFYYVYLRLFGLDISGDNSPSRVTLNLFLRYFSLSLILLAFLWYWFEIFWLLKDDYVEYGATLLHLVIAAHITSALLTHCTMHGRLDKIMNLINKLDSINAEIPFDKHELRDGLIALGFGILFLVVYTVVPVKWEVGKLFTKPIFNTTEEGLIAAGKKDYQAHLIGKMVLRCPLMSVLVIIVCTFDVVFFSFFILFAKRFNSVFRKAPFVKLLERSTKDDLSLIMQEFRKHHFSICNFVEDVDGAFAPVVLIWYVYQTMSLCCWIRSFGTEVFHKSVFGPPSTMINLVIAFTQFFLLSAATTLINDEVTAHLDTVRIMCIKEDVTSTASMDLVQERISHLSYVTCVLASPVNLTGWGFFSISKGFVLTVSSTILTFTLVLYGV